ncbi:hypothetical protein SAMN05421788_102145 [Filimonas lacunae]|uniref:DUF4468 domain-containing protein n=1 Tax=Filimonas lacunae TaxID=477680 RepID=A0A173MHY5_9BACT|nr:hypothetical protein [Filimonas lacunae]BAV07233.1 hypothetical protein FLA_3256 [Filimonas lacunae]SIS92841.1 hypothetical protein SAMN05421788_102145 [Filimonas lacunae]
MRYSFLWLAVFAATVIACNPNPGAKSPADSTINAAAAVTPYSIVQVVAKFTPMRFDTLRIDSPDTDSASRFWGRHLDSLDMSFLPEDVRWFEGIGAIGQFNLDSSHIGLLVRAHGEYTYKVVLLNYDKKLQQIISSVILAQNFGDAGYSSNLNSWLFTGGGYVKQALTNLEEYTDNSVENENDTTTTTSYQYALLKLEKELTDTAAMTQEELYKKFEHLLKHK